MIGTVSTVTPESITVRTTATKTVTVGVVPATTFTMGKMAMKLADLKVGNRVVIHAKEPKEGTLVADTVEFSTPKVAPAAASHAAAKAPESAAALEELIRQGDIALILPRTVVDEFARNKARVIEDSSRSLSSTLKRAKEATRILLQAR